MKAKVLDYGHIIEVSQDPENPNHFYEFGENGRLISDYLGDDLEFIEDDFDDGVQCVEYDNIWVARNRSGSLTMFTEKPVKNISSGRWESYNGFYMFSLFPGMDFSMFDKLKWEDEPLHLKIKFEVI